MARKKIATPRLPNKPQASQNLTFSAAQLHQMLDTVLSSNDAEAKDTVAFILTCAINAITKGGTRQPLAEALRASSDKTGGLHLSLADRDRLDAAVDALDELNHLLGLSGSEYGSLWLVMKPHVEALSEISDRLCTRNGGAA